MFLFRFFFRILLYITSLLPETDWKRIDNWWQKTNYFSQNSKLLFFVWQILDFQIDDIVRPRNLIGTEGRLRRTRAAVQAGRDAVGEKLHFLIGNKKCTQCLWGIKCLYISHIHFLHTSGFVSLQCPTTERILCFVSFSARGGSGRWWPPFRGGCPRQLRVGHVDYLWTIVP